MRPFFVIGGVLLAVMLSGPASAQMPNPQQFLQGLGGGNRDQDDALHEAFRRGYEKGRRDEAERMSQRDHRDHDYNPNYYPDRRQ
jgi:hypothetical protein